MARVRATWSPDRRAVAVIVEGPRRGDEGIPVLVTVRGGATRTVERFAPRGDRVPHPLPADRPRVRLHLATLGRGLGGIVREADEVGPATVRAGNPMESMTGGLDDRLHAAAIDDLTVPALLSLVWREDPHPALRELLLRAREAFGPPVGVG